MSDFEHRMKLTTNSRERLQILEEKRALCGVNTPPEILMEIKQIRNV